jgi:hypothetical protein
MASPTSTCHPAFAFAPPTTMDSLTAAGHSFHLLRLQRSPGARTTASSHGPGRSCRHLPLFRSGRAEFARRHHASAHPRRPHLRHHGGARLPLLQQPCSCP